MDSEALKKVRRDPPLRNSAGAVALLIGRLRAFLARFFAAKHPGDFDIEFGSWQTPDFNLVPGATRPAPRPLINRDCSVTYLVYTVAVIPVERCSLVGQLRALQQAIDEVAQYMRDEFRCEDPDCLQETGELVWIGLDCSRDPTMDWAAILVRFRCVPES